MTQVTGVTITLQTMNSTNFISNAKSLPNVHAQHHTVKVKGSNSWFSCFGENKVSDETVLHKVYLRK